MSPRYGSYDAPKNLARQLSQQSLRESQQGSRDSLIQHDSHHNSSRDTSASPACVRRSSSLRRQTAILDSPCSTTGSTSSRGRLEKSLSLQTNHNRYDSPSSNRESSTHGSREASSSPRVRRSSSSSLRNHGSTTIYESPNNPSGLNLHVSRRSSSSSSSRGGRSLPVLPQDKRSKPARGSQSESSLPATSNEKKKSQTRRYEARLSKSSSQESNNSSPRVTFKI